MFLKQNNRSSWNKPPTQTPIVLFQHASKRPTHLHHVANDPCTSDQRDQHLALEMVTRPKTASWPLQKLCKVQTFVFLTRQELLLLQACFFYVMFLWVFVVKQKTVIGEFVSHVWLEYFWKANSLSAELSCSHWISRTSFSKRWIDILHVFPFQMWTQIWDHCTSRWTMFIFHKHI